MFRDKYGDKSLFLTLRLKISAVKILNKWHCWQIMKCSCLILHFETITIWYKWYNSFRWTSLVTIQGVYIFCMYGQIAIKICLINYIILFLPENLAFLVHILLTLPFYGQNLLFIYTATTEPCLLGSLLVCIPNASQTSNAVNIECWIWSKFEANWRIVHVL